MIKEFTPKEWQELWNLHNNAELDDDGFIRDINRLIQQAYKAGWKDADADIEKDLADEKERRESALKEYADQVEPRAARKPCLVFAEQKQ
jgi:hypothetical protein